MIQQDLKIRQPYTRFYEILDTVILCAAEFGLFRVGLTWVRQSGYRYALGAAACFVFAAYFLYRYIDLRIGGRIYYAFITKRGNQVLVSNAHRYYFFRTEDIEKVTYDTETRLCVVSLRRCFARRSGLFTQDRLWIYLPGEERLNAEEEKIYHYMGNLKENPAQHLSITDDGDLWLGMFPKWTEIGHLTLCGLPMPYTFSVVCLLPKDAERLTRCIHPEENLQPEEEPLSPVVSSEEEPPLSE